MIRYLPFPSVLRAALVIVLAACAGCASLDTAGSVQKAAAAPLAPSENGAILERAACKIDTDPQAFSKALDDYYREDLLKAKLDKELAAQPLLSIFPPSENQALAEATREGRCERVVYRSSGLRVVGFVLRPASAGPHPVLIWLRGGNRDYGKIEQVTLLNLKWLADAGFVVIAPQYRGADGGEGTDEFGGADVEDVLALHPLARSLPDADAGRMYLIGGSRGAMQGALAMRRGLPVRAVAFRGGVFDLKASGVARPELLKIFQQVMPDYAAGPDQALERRSPAFWVREMRAPVLLVHGREDWRVDLKNAQAFDALLDGTGLEHKLVIYERDEHQIVLHRKQWLGEALQWFRMHGAYDVRAGRQP